MFFAAISGSGPATVAAIGGFMIPEMKNKKYDGGFAAAVSASAGSIGVIFSQVFLSCYMGLLVAFLLEVCF